MKKNSIPYFLGSRFCAVLLFSIFYFLFSTPASAATNINSSTLEHWAWNDIVGWMDFYNTDTITVASNATTTGYASSSVGDISLDCATTRSGNICSQSNYGVVSNGVGNYSGWAWNDQYGWISFWCGNSSGCDSSNYRVVINGSTGQFSGWAWNDVIGWVSFSCVDQGICGVSDYRVVTSWRATSTTGILESSTFDTTASGGVQLNSVLWQGDLPIDTTVRFQFAASNSSSGPWTFSGTDGTSSTYYTTDPNASLKLNYSLYNNKRYFRYKAFLFSNTSSTQGPRIDDIIVNWSP